MKKKLLFIVFYAISLNAQVGIGTTTPNAILDINSSLPSPSTDKAGLLPPVVELTATNSNTTTTIGVNIVNPNGGGAPAQGTIVYNTNTSAPGPYQVTPGYYFYNGTIWEKISSGTNTNWTLIGNAGTTAGTNFIGTTDSQDLRFKTGGINRFNISNTNGQLQSYNLGTTTNPTYSFQGDQNTGIWSSAADNLNFSTDGTQRMIIGSNGNIGVSTSVPATTKMEVLSSGTDDAVFGHTPNVGGVLGRETDIIIGVPPQTISGAGVFASNPTAGYTSSFSQSTGAATVAANINYSDVWMASYNYVQNGSATYNPSANYNQLNITNNTLGGTQVALKTYLNRGTLTGNPGFSVGIQGIANSQNQDSFGVQGSAFCNTNTRAGGYFESLNYAGTSQAYAYVGTTATTGVARKIMGTNSVSEIVPTEKHGRVTLTCPESPEYWYQDYGTVQMTNGKATIILDEILSDIIIVDEENPIRVICTPVGMPFFNGVTIMNQTTNSVEILELNGGNHSGKLQYQIVVKPKTGYGEGRFPQAPGPAYLKSDKEPLAAKTKNQPNDGRKIFQWPADHIVYKYNPEDFIKIGDVVPAGPNAGKIFLGNGKYNEGNPATVINKK
ncbi:hypothetical protein [Flavobacterium urocaniciphilum]|uniref:Uncharacterized protein n=1 Tax=Flavobacterium urocaniciphilum TaxID=1299341 RepID=A0A1H8ZPE7_9FLAO|nr:hypothetical protein [Flavobacterium urocaniciphilum]SEP66177.1 hypothetical protein SAMN05444005_101822 [Flavobacterium urocaniciphilum]